MKFDFKEKLFYFSSCFLILILFICFMTFYEFDNIIILNLLFALCAAINIYFGLNLKKNKLLAVIYSVPIILLIFKSLIEASSGIGFFFSTLYGIDALIFSFILAFMFYPTIFGISLLVVISYFLSRAMKKGNN